MNGDQRDCAVGESTITVKWWGVLIIIIATFGFLMTSSLSQERRITTLEMQFGYMTKTIDEVRDISKEIRNDQIRRFDKFEGKK